MGIIRKFDNIFVGVDGGYFYLLVQDSEKRDRFIENYIYFESAIFLVLEINRSLSMLLQSKIENYKRMSPEERINKVSLTEKDIQKLQAILNVLNDAVYRLEEILE